MQASDLNRIGGNLQYLSEKLNLPFSPDVYTEESKPTASGYEKIIFQTALIRQNYIANPDTPDIPQMPLNSYEKYNAIEKNLLDIYERFAENSKATIFSGEIFAGESIGVI